MLPVVQQPAPKLPWGPEDEEAWLLQPSLEGEVPLQKREMLPQRLEVWPRKRERAVVLDNAGRR